MAVAVAVAVVAEEVQLLPLQPLALALALAPAPVLVDEGVAAEVGAIHNVPLVLTNTSRMKDLPEQLLLVLQLPRRFPMQHPRQQHGRPQNCLQTTG